MSGKSRLNVLVVDRDDANVVELKDLLAAQGYQVQVESEPALVLEQLKSGKVQLVMLDVASMATKTRDIPMVKIPSGCEGSVKTT